MSSITLHEGDNRVTLRRLIDEGVRVHSVVTDPPYGLVSTVKRFGKDGAAAAKSNGATGVFKRASGGFMGSTWDATGIERDPEFWALIYDILLPGGYVLAFSSPRTGHWQACAMEMAGFVMHPFFGWTYGSGFPKAHNAAMAIDKALGVKGSRGGLKAGFEGHAGKDNLRSLRESGTMSQNGGFSRPWMHDPEAVLNNQLRYVPGSPEAQQWDGWAYGAQSLKPALEPIYFAEKPFAEKNGALNLIKHGVGAVNIDACRVPAGAGDGRHPANLLHDGSPEVTAMFPNSKGAQASVKGTEPSLPTNEIYGQFRERLASPKRADGDGSAARFFNSFQMTDAEIDELIELGIVSPPIDAEPLRYHSKATKADRAGTKHPTVKPIGLMEWLVTLVTPPGGMVLDPFAGSGTTGAAAQRAGFDCILMEAESQFATDIRKRLKLTMTSEFDDILGMDVGNDEFDDILG